MQQIVEIVGRILLFIVSMFFLVFPTGFAVWEDRKGDKHPNNDLVIIGFMMVIASVAVSIMNHGLTNIFWQTVKACSFSLGIFVFFFPYIVNYVHFKNKVTSVPTWWDHLSNRAWPDKWHVWSSTPWKIRMLVAFLIAFILCSPYFIF